MEEFPHLVQMQERYGKDGLVCLSVNTDYVEDKNKALDFLTKQNATFANYLLDERSQFWQDKWDVNGLPLVFVFDRDNTRVGKFDVNDPKKPFDYANVENMVRRLLASGGPKSPEMLEKKAGN